MLGALQCSASVCQPSPVYYLPTPLYSYTTNCCTMIILILYPSLSLSLSISPENTDGKEEGVSESGDGDVSSPSSKKAKKGKGRGKGGDKAHGEAGEEETMGDGPLEAEDITEETVQAVVGYR